MATILNLKEFDGERLFWYFETKHPDREYANIVALIPYATIWDNKKACAIIERVVKENKTLIATYPHIPELSKDTAGMEYVGGIMDGGEMYISDKPYFNDRIKSIISL